MNKKRNKNHRLLVVMAITLKEMFVTFKCGVVEELGKIAVLLQVLIPVVIVKLELTPFGMLFASCVLVICIRYIQEVGYKLNNVTERGFPISRRRFTKKDEEGFINIEEEDIQEAILYLCEVEDYVRKKGVYQLSVDRRTKI